MKHNLAELSYPEAPKIVIKPPGPKSLEITKKIDEYSPKRMRMSVPCVWESAKGATVKDVDGNVYIEFGAGFHAASTGFCHPVIIQAVKDQLDKMSVPPAQFDVEARYYAAKKITSICPPGLNNAMLATSGTESVETAVKFARLYTKRKDIISLHRHYHGKGFLATKLTGTHGPYGPYANGVLHGPSPYCYRCPFKLEHPDCDLVCADYINEVIANESKGGVYGGKHNVAALIMEPLARVGGTPKGYLTKIKKICSENEVLFIADEVTCGSGRTGKWWMCDWENVIPDMLVIGKGASSGIPSSILVTTKEITEEMPIGINEGNTWGMNPIQCAAISATIDVMIEEKMLENALSVGNYFTKRLAEMKEDHAIIGDVQSFGLNTAIELVKDRKTKEPWPEAGTEIFT